MHAPTSGGSCHVARVKKRARSFWNTPVPEILSRWRYGQLSLGALSFLAGIYLHAVFVHALVSGKIKGRYGWQWIEARASLPLGYWIFVTVFGALALLADLWFLWILRNAWKNRQNERRR